MIDRERLGRIVRDVWIEWAKEQPAPKPSWLVPWEGLSEPDREVDRRIGERLAREGTACPECGGHYLIADLGDFEGRTRRECGVCLYGFIPPEMGAHEIKRAQRMQALLFLRDAGNKPSLGSATEKARRAAMDPGRIKSPADAFAVLEVCDALESRLWLDEAHAALRDAVVRWKAREEEYDIACSENPDGGGANPKRLREAGQRCDDAAAALRRLVG